jgi:hypothetical protein
MIASMGATGPGELTPQMLRRRIGHLETKSYAELYDWMEPGELLSEVPGTWARDWEAASPDAFGARYGTNGRTLA